MINDDFSYIDVDQVFEDSALKLNTQETWISLLRSRGIDVKDLGSKSQWNFLRLDGEARSRSPVSDLDLSQLFSFGVDKKYSSNAAWCIFNTLCRVNAVLTDRLHIGIAAALIGIPCVLQDNSYGKNKAVYDFSIDGRVPNVSFSAS